MIVKNFFLIFLTLLVSIECRDNLNYSPFDCGPSLWDIDNSDAHIAHKLLQEWIFAFQFACTSSYQHGISTESASVGGLGSSLMFESKYFMKALELRQIFRPMHNPGTWLWADRDPANCTLGVQSYDCFFEPTSDCGLNIPRSLELEKQVNESEASRSIELFKDLALMDVCSMAKKLKKSVKFVHGNLMIYLSRPAEKLKKVVHHRTKQVYSNLMPNTVSIAVQLRTGELDNGRLPANNLTVIVSIIDRLVNKLHSENKTVGMVYLCSNLPDENFISAEYMMQHFPRHYQYRTSEHAYIGHDDFEKIFRSPGHEKVDHLRFDLISDFYTDVEIMSEADYVIGSNSNVYMVAAGLRAGRRRKTTIGSMCFIDWHSSDFPLVCEGSPTHKGIWAFYFSPRYTHFENE